MSFWSEDSPEAFQQKLGMSIVLSIIVMLIASMVPKWRPDLSSTLPSACTGTYSTIDSRDLRSNAALDSRDFLQSLSYDWKVLSGRKGSGCRWGGVFFYFTTRYISFVPAICAVILWSMGATPLFGVTTVLHARDSAKYPCSQGARYAKEVSA